MGDVARLLDAEDIVNMPRPDERSIMTYVAQLYAVFSSLDKVETAGRRVGKFTDFSKTVEQLQSDYESRARALKDAVDGKTAALPDSPLGDDYDGARGYVAEFSQYRKGQRREWIAEQSDLAALLGNIQAKLKVNNLPPYSPPEDITTASLESSFDGLFGAESGHRSSLNQNLRKILDDLRKSFASVANPMGDNLTRIRGVLNAGSDASLEDQLATLRQNADELNALSGDLENIAAAEAACEHANIEENEYTDHTHDDLQFEHGRLSALFQKKIDFLENQIAAAQQEDISPEQIKEFKETFSHFDQDNDEKLSRLEFKSCLSGLGVVELDFEGGDKRFESIFNKVSGGAEEISFDQFTDYMVSITKDETSPEQIQDSFEVLAGGKDHITENDMKVGQMSAEQIEFLKSQMPPKEGIEGGYDFRTWLASKF